MLDILLLGSPHVRRDGRIIDIERRKSRALLFYLAARRTPVLREQLLILFWPDHERSAAQQTLRTTIHGLRKALGDDLVAQPDTVALVPGTTVDIQRFETQIEAPQSTEALALALALYRGPFLEGFSLPDSEEFERWLETERERTRQLAIHGAVELARLHESQQNFPAALSVLARAQALDSLHEELQRMAMRVQYRSGDRAGAIRRYEQLREELDNELGVPPMPETRSLYDAIITDSVEALAPLAPAALAAPPIPQSMFVPPRVQLTDDTLPFAGRQHELEQIDAASIAHRLILIEGEPGIGKTRLVEEWQRKHQDVVLVGAAYELERSLPYQPMIEALRGLCADAHLAPLRTQIELSPFWWSEITRLLPELDTNITPNTRTTDESRLWEGVRRLLVALAQHQRIVLFIDDLHWADESTLALLSYLVRQSGDTAITYVATTRPIAARTRLAALQQSLARAGLVERISLERFSNDDVGALAHQIAPHASPRLTRWLSDISEGNPFVLAELVRYARDHGWLNGQAAQQLANEGSPVVPQGVSSLIESRLATLSAPAQQILDLAVAIGREFDFAVVAKALELSEDQVLDGLDELREAGLIHPIEATRFQFDHSLTMEVAYRLIGEPRHRRMHRQVAAALIALAGNRIEQESGLIASHLFEGGAIDQAAPYALTAGRRAASLAAWQEAIGFFELALGGSDNNNKATIMLELGRARSNLGNTAQASDELREAVHLAEHAGDLRLARLARIELARSLIPQGRFEEIMSTVAALDNTPDAASAAFFRGVALSIEGADLAGATEHLRKAAQLLHELPPPQDGLNQTRITFELGGIAAQQGNLTEAIRRYREVLADTQIAETESDALSWYVLAYNNLAYHLLLLGDQSAMEYAQKGLQLARERGIPSILPYLHSTIGEILLSAGDLDGAEQAFHEGLALAEQFSMPERIAGLNANLGLIAIQRGETALAIHRLSTALAQADAIGTRHLAAQIQIWLAPLLPTAEGSVLLEEARANAESAGRKLLLDQIAQLESHASDT